MNKSSSKSDEISDESGSTWDISSIQDSSNNQDSKIMKVAVPGILAVSRTVVITKTVKSCLITLIFQNSS